VLGLDQNGGYLLAAFAITVIVLAGYALYLRSRLLALRRRRAGADYSARNVAAAAPMASTAQVASSAKGQPTP
jgi:hypothetical protein